MLPRKKEEDKELESTKREEKIVELEQKLVNRLRHVDDITKGKEVNFKLLF